MSENFQTSKNNGAHYKLSQLAGEWKGTAKTWFEPDTVADESPIKGSIRVIMDGRFIIHEYKGSLNEKPLEGMNIIGYNLSLNKFESAWIDSFHTGTAIMFSEGNRNAENLSVLGSYAYVTPDTEQHWGWRTNIEMISNDEIKIIAYNISPDGEESKATEIHYKRTN